ncbi:L-aspartate oxidase [Paenibacillus turicensis]|uniref:L-aspartate oxidase n=1 Tax=Paenibacillus turicensis TaxID=160487 RepID=A0ABS4FXS6_9BACL|nr:L-aspartate oxidase [Paenibacillus turicensis]MBP1907386.1 L-aspartate oxidase [Paenibacillus turicensis]
MIPQYLVDFNLADMSTIETDVLVVGSGIAGLYAALEISSDKKVILATKHTLLESNTRYAQGGIAAVISKEDSASSHKEDTLNAGAGLCSLAAVDVLVHEGPERVQQLIEWGTLFDVEQGELALTREGAHSFRRILHANGDATGYEIVRALSYQVLNHPNVTVWEDHFVIDLITQEGQCLGALIERPEGERVFVKAGATILCSGGSGQLYRYTTNPEIATSDGIAIAYRAGAVIRDMEFIQFHPTALCYPGAPRFLISEAVRGEGAVLRNTKGERFMYKYDNRLELAPRDIVARAIVQEMEETHANMVYLDITHESPELIRHRFPTIYATCIQYGLDMTTDWIPVAPAAHYMMGGVKSDINGQTNLSRLFACGEVSSTGVHGANRLASNSLSEAIVFGKRIANAIGELSPLSNNMLHISIKNDRKAGVGFASERRLRLQRIMVRLAGLKRSEAGLLQARTKLMKELEWFQYELHTREQWELANLLTSAQLVVEGALKREESRGGHYREDFPLRDDVKWKRHILQHRTQGMMEEINDDIK